MWNLAVILKNCPEMPKWRLKGNDKTGFSRTISYHELEQRPWFIGTEKWNRRDCRNCELTNPPISWQRNTTRISKSAKFKCFFSLVRRPNVFVFVIPKDQKVTLIRSKKCIRPNQIRQHKLAHHVATVVLNNLLNLPIKKFWQWEASLTRLADTKCLPICQTAVLLY